MNISTRVPVALAAATISSIVPRLSCDKDEWRWMAARYSR